MGYFESFSASTTSGKWLQQWSFPTRRVSLGRKLAPTPAIHPDPMADPFIAVRGGGGGMEGEEIQFYYVSKKNTTRGIIITWRLRQSQFFSLANSFPP